MWSQGRSGYTIQVACSLDAKNYRNFLCCRGGGEHLTNRNSPLTQRRTTSPEVIRQSKWSRPKPNAFRHLDYHELVSVGLYFFQFAQNMINLCRILVHSSWNKDLLNMLSKEIIILDNNQGTTYVLEQYATFLRPVTILIVYVKPTFISPILTL